jgi:nicotinamidase-related amidase
MIARYLLRGAAPLAAVLLLSSAPLAAPPDAPKEPAKADWKLPLRCRVETFKGSGEYDEVTVTRAFDPKECAIILCDVWDKHWCDNATTRCGELAKKMVPVLESARKRGVIVIHAPSECMDFYKDAPQRKAMKEVPPAVPPKARDLPDPALPVDASDGGCDDDMPREQRRAWKSEHPAIPIADNDFISDSGAEVYSLLKQRGVKTLFVMGVHTNMCVLNRTFAIKQMTKWGIRCVLVRDLTDAMYAPRGKPFVSHEEGTELIIQHIEKHWCPTVLSADLKK